MAEVTACEASPQNSLGSQIHFSVILSTIFFAMGETTKAVGSATMNPITNDLIHMMMKLETKPTAT